MNASANLIGLGTITRREVVRILRIWSQTLLPPAITMTLYFIIFGSLVGNRIGQVLQHLVRVHHVERIIGELQPVDIACLIADVGQPAPCGLCPRLGCMCFLRYGFQNSEHARPDCLQPVGQFIAQAIDTTRRWRASGIARARIAERQALVSLS